MKIVVTGASGRTSRKIADNLLARGISAVDLILVSRSPERAELAPYAAAGAVLRYGDFTDLASLPQALAGGERMYLMPMNHPPNVIDEAAVKCAVVSAARSAGIRYCVYQSFIAAGSARSSDDDLATENALKASGMNWSILRTAIFAESLGRECKRYIREGRIPASDPFAARAYVTRDDIAAAGAELLIGSGHEGKTYNAVGAVITMQELAAVLSQLSGRAVEIVASDRSVWAGGIAAPPSDLPRLVGRPGHSVLDQLRENKRELLTGVPVGGEVKFGFQWQARGLETRPEDIGLRMHRLHAAAKAGDEAAAAEFAALLGENPIRSEAWRYAHPDWFSGESKN